MMTENAIRKRKGGDPLLMLTAYDALFARIFSEIKGIDILLVGDSVGNVVAGRANTTSVTLDQMIYHTQMVRAGALEMFVVADMPFMTYPYPEEDALHNVRRLVQEGGAHAVKIEGAAPDMCVLIQKITTMGCPVMGHVGLTPQQVYRTGYARRGSRADDAARLMDDAAALDEAGVFAIVLECVEPETAARITHSVTTPTIGIGSGSACDGQVLVSADMLGLSAEPPPFVKPYADLKAEIARATHDFVKSVRREGDPR